MFNLWLDGKKNRRARNKQRRRLLLSYFAGNGSNPPTSPSPSKGRGGDKDDGGTNRISPGRGYRMTSGPQGTGNLLHSHQLCLFLSFFFSRKWRKIPHEDYSYKNLSYPSNAFSKYIKTYLKLPKIFWFKYVFNDFSYYLPRAKSRLFDDFIICPELII
jgi:hypothetical protein